MDFLGILVRFLHPPSKPQTQSDVLDKPFTVTMADEDDVCSFYGAVVTSGGKGTEIKVKPGRVLLLKQAALAKPSKERMTLSIKCDGQELVVCSLTQSCEQVCIDLAFGPANKATLVLKGSPGCAVHICGAPRLHREALSAAC